MRRAGWLSHPVAAVNTEYGKGARLNVALRNTETYEAFVDGRTPPSVNTANADRAKLTYTDADGTHVREVFVDSVARLVVRIDDTSKTPLVAFLGDFPRPCLTIMPTTVSSGAEI